MRSVLIAVLIAAALAATGAAANAMTRSETAFVQSMQKDLTSRFATIEDAKRAGYFRFTLEDSTGAISYVNLHWTSTDPQHPSQLWYDVHGKLLGADFSVPYIKKPPTLWGIEPTRWVHFPAHVHWVEQKMGKETYGATGTAKFVKAGGSLSNPQPATVVRLGKASNATQITHVFLFPSIWDISVWITPNPKGAFAEANPLVKPSKTAGKEGM